MKQEKYAVIIQESLVSSIIKDAVTFCVFAGLMLFNHQLLDGSAWVDVMFVMFIFLWMVSKGSKDVFKGSVEDAIKWLAEK